jgi:hypothetical protein
MWNDSKRVAGQWLFRKDIDKIKRNLHYALSRSGIWFIAEIWVDPSNSAYSGPSGPVIPLEVGR